MRTSRIVANLDRERILVDADAGDVLTVFGNQRYQQIALRNRGLWINQGFVQITGAAPRADVRQIRTRDSTIAVDRMANCTIALTPVDFGTVRRIARHRLQRYPSE